MTDEEFGAFQPIAARAVVAVKDRDADEIAAVLNSLDRRGLSALVVLLAALIPDDVRMGPVLEAVS